MQTVRVNIFMRSHSFNIKYIAMLMICCMSAGIIISLHVHYVMERKFTMMLYLLPHMIMN